MHLRFNDGPQASRILPACDWLKEAYPRRSSSAVIASTIQTLWSLHKGAKVPPQSISGTCEHPSTTSRLLNTISALILNTQRVPTTFRSFGTELMGNSSYMPCFPDSRSPCLKPPPNAPLMEGLSTSSRRSGSVPCSPPPKRFLARWWRRTRILH